MNRSMPIPTYQGKTLFDEENAKRNGRVPNESIRVDVAHKRVTFGQNIARFIRRTPNLTCTKIDSPWELMLVISKGQQGHPFSTSNSSATLCSASLCRDIADMVGEQHQVFDLEVTIKEWGSAMWISIERRKHE